MLPLARFAAFQGLTGTQTLLTVPDLNHQWIITGIDVTPASSLGIAFAITIGTGGTKVFVGAQSATDPIKTFSWRGRMPMYGTETLVGSESGGSIDVIVSGYPWPLPTPTQPSDAPL